MANAKDVAAGGILAAIGSLYFAVAYSKLPFGSAMDMGPGYVPMALSGLLVILGGAIALRGARRLGDLPFGRVAWRGILFVNLALLVFVFTLHPLGLFLCASLTALLTSCSMPAIALSKRLGISVGIGVFCTVVFVFLIRLPLPVLGTIFS